MKDELSNSVVEEINKPDTQNENLNNQEVSTEVVQENVQNVEVIHNDGIPQKSNKFPNVLVILFIIAVIGGSVYYFTLMNNSKNDKNQVTTTSSCDGDVCTMGTSSSTSKTSSTSATREDQVLVDYLSKVKKSYNPIEGAELLGSKYYKISLEEYTKCNGDNNVSFDYKNHKISYKCIPIDMGNDTDYVAKGLIDSVNITTGNDNDDIITCGSYSFFGDDNTVIIYKPGNCDGYYPIGTRISFYSKDGKLKKEINVLTFSLNYINVTYRVHPYNENNNIYYIPSVNEHRENVDTNFELHKLDLTTFEDTVIYNFVGKIIFG